MILFIDTHDELITIAIKNSDKLYVKTKLSEYSHWKFYWYKNRAFYC